MGGWGVGGGLEKVWENTQHGAMKNSGSLGCLSKSLLESSKHPTASGTASTYINDVVLYFSDASTVIKRVYE